jgi:hypothetical protein
MGLLLLYRNLILYLDFKLQNLRVHVFLLKRVNDLKEIYHPDICDDKFKLGLISIYSAL